MVPSDIRIDAKSGLLVPATDAITFETASPELAAILFQSPEAAAAKMHRLCLDAYNSTEALLLTPIATLLEAPHTIGMYLPDLPDPQVLQTVREVSRMLDDGAPAVPADLEKSIQTVQQHRSLLQSFTAEDLSTADVRAFKSLLPELALSFRSHALEIPLPSQGIEHFTAEPDRDVLALSIRALRQMTESMQPLLQVIRSSVQAVDTGVMDEVGRSLQKVLLNLGFLCNPAVTHAPADTPALFRASHAFHNACDEWNGASLSDTLGLKAAATTLTDSISGFLSGRRGAVT